MSIREVAEATQLWQEIVDASSDGWLWHTWTAREFNLCAGQKFNAVDHSFFVYEGERAVGVVPLMIQDKTIGVITGREATYYSGFLPWPCFRGDLDPERKQALETFAFSELERRARAAGAGRIAVLLSPPEDRGAERGQVARIANEHHYVYLPSPVQVVPVTAPLLAAAKSRYDYKRFSPFISMEVAEGATVTPELEESYFTLHVKDAGGQFRSRESYTKQADTARAGEGFYMVARHKESGAIAGIALISVYKDAAYYNSVAIDPAYQKLCVGYQLQCRIIEELLARGVSTYALGPKWDISMWHSLVSDKKRDILRFKDKFSRHQSREFYLIEKFLDPAFFDAYLGLLGTSLKEYFGLS